LRWIWWHILDDNPDPPSAEEIAAEAADEDQRYPECHGAMFRRRHPDWLACKVESAAEYHSYRAWHELRAALDGNRGLPGERLRWLQTHEPAIRGLIADVKAEHRRRWPERSPGLRG
jgi:hypothetical protein